MAKKNTNANGTEMAIDIPVVAPINMGKGLLYDADTGRYNVDIDSKLLDIDAKTGKLSIRVSELEGNIIQTKSDGIYVGSKTPDEVANLYVDGVDGVDQDPYTVPGAGTRGKPLRTLSYAIGLMFPGTPSNIYLKVKQVHNLPRSKRVKIIGNELSIAPYGDDYDNDKNTRFGGSNSAVNIEYVKTGQAPVIYMNGSSESVYPSVSKERTTFSREVLDVGRNSLRLEGIILRDDLNAVFQKNSEAKTDKFSFVTPNRIVTNYGSSVAMYRCKLESVGAPSFSSDLDQSHISDYQYDGGKWSLGFVTARGVSFTLFDLYGVPENSAIIGNSGWSEPMSSSTSVSLISVGTMFSGDKVKEVTKRVVGKKVSEQNGVKIALVPQVDIDPTLWV